MTEPQPDVKQNDKLLVAEGLEVSYGTTQVLWGVSFSVARGKVTCIIGSNGAGKTTSLNTVAGMLRAKKGRLLLNGDDITSLSARDRVRRHMILVPEGRQLWLRRTRGTQRRCPASMAPLPVVGTKAVGLRADSAVRP